jgi:hypothetical protein
MMQVSKDTPGELAALTNLKSLLLNTARCKACAEEAAQGEGQFSKDACNGQSKIWGLRSLHRLYEPLKFIYNSFKFI